METLFKAWFIEAHVTHPGNRQVFISYRLNQQGFSTLETLFKAWFIEAHVTHPGNRQVFSSYMLNQQGFNKVFNVRNPC
jgi:hypothetical protein